jgi:hypothetical protein
LLKKNKEEQTSLEIFSYSAAVTYQTFYIHLMMKLLWGFANKKRFCQWRIFCWSWPKNLVEGVDNTVVPVQCLVHDDDDNRGGPRTRVSRPGDVTNNN